MKDHLTSLISAATVSLLTPFLTILPGARGRDFPISEADLDLVARTIWGEARGEGPAGWIAVAHVIRRRAENPRWWGRTVSEVVLAPAQFSVWSDPEIAERLRRVPQDDSYLMAVRAAAYGVFRGVFADPTNGADHYHSTSIAPPLWARDRKPCAHIGRHVFYRIEV